MKRTITAVSDNTIYYRPILLSICRRFTPSTAFLVGCQNYSILKMTADNKNFVNFEKNTYTINYLAMDCSVGSKAVTYAKQAVAS